jgi:nitroreductase
MTTLERSTLSMFDALQARRSVRSYAPTRLDERTVRALLEAAVLAPTAMHLEPWTFVVVQDQAMLRRISDRAKALLAAQAAVHPGGGLPFPKDFDIFYDAGTLVVICARPLGPFVTADCWLAAENLILAATAQGLGTCVIGFAVAALNTPDIKAALDIPADETAVAPIIVGVPKGETPPVGRKEPVVLHWR